MSFWLTIKRRFDRWSGGAAPQEATGRIDRTPLIAECKLRFSQGADPESLVSFLREQGCFKIDSIVVLRETLGLDLQQAKELVHCSQTWSDHREADDRLHDQIFEELGAKEK